MDQPRVLKTTGLSTPQAEKKKVKGKGNECHSSSFFLFFYPERINEGKKEGIREGGSLTLALRTWKPGIREESKAS